MNARREMGFHNLLPFRIEVVKRVVVLISWGITGSGNPQPYPLADFDCGILYFWTSNTATRVSHLIQLRLQDSLLILTTVKRST
jgi:hypothetical protein